MHDSNIDDYDSIEAELEAGFQRMLVPEEISRAQAWANWLDEAIGLLPSESRLYQRSLYQLRDLCGRTGVLPESYFLADEVLLEDTDPVSQGGFSDVYYGFCSGTPVALKSLRIISTDQKKVMKAFSQEVVVWKRLNHPNIVPFMGVSPLFPFCLVSPWMPHGSLRAYMDQNPGVDRSMWVRIVDRLQSNDHADCLDQLIDVAKGLKYMHGLGLVHGDLKSANVLLDGDLQARLTDFGLAGVMHHTVGFTTASVLQGSIRWMSYELLGFETSPSRPTMHSDIWALAVVWWELVTGLMPYADVSNDIQVIGKLFQRQLLPTPDGIHPRLWQLMQSCWDRDPSARPDISKAIDQLQQLDDGADTEKSNDSPQNFQWLHKAVPIPSPTSTSPQSPLLKHSPPQDLNRTQIALPISVIPVLALQDESIERFEEPPDIGMVDDSASWALVSSPVSLAASITSENFKYDSDAEVMDTGQWQYAHPMCAAPHHFCIAFASNKGLVRLWSLDVDSFECQTFRASDYAVAIVALSPNGRIVTCGNMYDPITRIWDLQSGLASTTPPVRSDIQVKRVAFSQNGLYMSKLGVDVDGSASLQIWRNGPLKMTGSVTYSTEELSSPPKMVIWSLYDHDFVILGRLGPIRAYHLSEDGAPMEWAQHTPHLDWQVEAAAYSTQHTIRLLHLEWWTHRLQCTTMDLRTGLSTAVELPNPAARTWRTPNIACIAFSQNGNRIAVGFAGGHIQVYNAGDGRPIGKILEHEGGPHKFAITGLAFSPTSDCLFATDEAGWCWLWHVPSARAVMAFTLDGGVEYHHDVAVLTKFRELVVSWKNEQRERRDSVDDLKDASLPGSGMK